MNNQFDFNFKRYYTNTLFIIKIYLLGLVLLNIFRFSFICNFGQLNDIIKFKNDYVKALLTGFRFDTIVLCYGLALPFLLSFLFLFSPIKSVKFDRFLLAFFKIFGCFILIVFSLVSFIDVFFYKFFYSHINVTAFGIFDDDTSALMKSIWTDYPLIKIILAIIFVSFLVYFLLSSFLKKEKVVPFKRLSLKLGFIVLSIGLFILGMRCSFGNVPLEYMESTVSSNTFINQVALNGEFALKNAYKEYKKNKIDTCFSSNLKQHNFKTMLDAIEMYTGKRLEQNIDSLFTATTPINKELQQSPPNIIIIQVESMSGFYFNLHTPELNLLGALEEELKYCTVFHNFLPCRDFTIFTLDGLLINSPKSPLSQSQFLNKFFSTSAILPFKNAGYNTRFITGGRMNWRNLDMFLPQQGFDECEGGANIQKYYPNAKEEHEWGLYDEFMFNRMGDILETKSDKPRFIYAMTITNHTPFKIPENYKISSITYKESLLPHFKGNNERLLQTFKCYQYTNDCLGKFIRRIRNSPAGKNTIIVAFGDHAEHNLGDFFSLNDKTLFQKNAVPCIFYIPEKYRKNLKIDTARYGSHRDIFPTLYSLALSNRKYIKSGNNLFSDQPESSFTALFNYNLAMDKNGCVLFNNNKPVYLHWKNQATHELDYNNKPNKELIELYNKSRAYSCLINELIRLQLKK